MRPRRRKIIHHHTKPRFLKLRRILAFGVIGLILFSIPFYFFILKDLPSSDKLDSPNSYPASTRIYDRNDKLLYEIFIDKNRTPINVNNIPSFIKFSTISAEDKNFYKHKGFAITGIIRAAFNTVFRRSLQGGSTISQQLVKNTLLTQDRTIKRKIREAILTITVETLYPKDKILEMYLNQIPYGGTAYGISAAAQTFFGKDVTKLTLSEAALLAGLPASPSRYSPFGNHPELAKARQEYILDEMVKNGYLKPHEADAAKKEPLVYRIRGEGIKAPHFVMYIKDILIQKYGQQMVEGGGLKVTTSLDLEIQNLAQESVATEVAKLKKEKVSNGAALVINPQTGEILAMVGSKDYFDTEIDGNVNVTTSLRQPGSSIKPLVYATAIDRKIINSATVLLDIPTCFTNPGQKTYCPENYDRGYHGPAQVRFALGNSYNIPAVKVMALGGLSDFLASASAMGFTTLTDPKNYGLSLALGGGEIKMTELASAFGILANKGILQTSSPILKVESSDGTILESVTAQEGTQIFSPETTYVISHILLDNNARQPMFGASSYLVVKNHPEVSVKTGTTNDKRDNWTIGYTPSYVVAVWVGNNDNTSMSAVASGITGASPIWNKIFRGILEKKDKEIGKNSQEWPVKPEGIGGASVCVDTGLLPGSSGCQVRYDYFLPGTIPTATSGEKKQIQINKTNSEPIQPGQQVPPENIETQEHPAIIDLTGEILCLDCPYPSSPAILNPQTLLRQ